MLPSPCFNSSLHLILLHLSQFSVCNCSILAAAADLSQLSVYRCSIFAAAADAYICTAWQRIMLHAKIFPHMQGSFTLETQSRPATRIWSVRTTNLA